MKGSTQKLTEADWGTPEWQSGCVKMMEVFEEKQMLEVRLGESSFSLGLSQDPNFTKDFNTPLQQVACLYALSLFV